MLITQGGRRLWLAPWRLRRTLRQLGQARSLAGLGPGLPSQRLRELKAVLSRARRCERGWVAPAYGGALTLRLQPGAAMASLESIEFLRGGEMLSAETSQVALQSQESWSEWRVVCTAQHLRERVPASRGIYVLSPAGHPMLRYIGLAGDSLRSRVAAHLSLAQRYGGSCLRVQYVALPGRSVAELRAAEHAVVRAYRITPGFKVTTETPREPFRAIGAVRMRLPAELHQRFPGGAFDVAAGALSREFALP